MSRQRLSDCCTVRVMVMVVAMVDVMVILANQANILQVPLLFTNHSALSILDGNIKAYNRTKRARGCNDTFRASFLPNTIVE